MEEGLTVIKIKRAYEPAESGDGFRILVDRLWPRGLTKEKADVDLWLKDIAPSDELRQWFGHEPEKWPEFERRYWKELDGEADDVQTIRDKAKSGIVTLLFGAKEERYNNAVALRHYIEKKPAARKAKGRRRVAA